MPDQSGNVDGEATWYCTWSYELVFEHFVLEGHKWLVSEKELKDLIPGTITGWEYKKIGTAEDGKTWSDFRAKVSFGFFPSACLLLHDGDGFLFFVNFSFRKRRET